MGANTKAIGWASIAVIIAATGYMVYTATSLGSRQEDAREAAHQESYAAGLSQGYDAGYAEGFAEAYASGHDDGHPGGDARGYEDAYPAGFEEGRTEGYGAGYSVGLDEGQVAGEEAGYADGETLGFQSGYAQAFPDGLEDGREIGLTTRVDLHNPTYWEMREFVVNDGTNATTYDLDNHNCMDYSIMVVNNAEALGIRAGIVLIGYEAEQGVETPGHAIVVFDTTDQGLSYVEPQSDWPVYPEIGIPYRDSVPLPEGYSYPESLPNNTIENIQIIW